MIAVLFSLVLAAQTPTEPARDLFLHSARAGGVELRFVDYHWQPALFEAMEKGSGSGGEVQATRNWVVARLTLQTRTLMLGGKRMGVGVYAVALWPNSDGKGMTVEVRNVDMREVLPSLNAMAPLPSGESIYRGPARLEPLVPLAERLDATLAEQDGGIVLTLRYGNRRLTLAFAQ
jgi:hypothetical protein